MDPSNINHRAGQQQSASYSADSAASGNPNGAHNLRGVLDTHEWMRSSSPAVPYGHTGRVGGYQSQRVQEWMGKTGWDGDLRWPPPGFLEAESARRSRLDALQRQQEELTWQSGQTELAQSRRDEAEARMWQQRSQHGGSFSSAGPRPQPPFGRR